MSATLLLVAGVHPKVVQERLGHSQISVTLDTYSHVLPSMQREAAAKMDEMLRPQPASSATAPTATTNPIAAIASKKAATVPAAGRLRIVG